MARLRRTRRIRNERWYSVWDQIGLAFLTKDEISCLAASTPNGRKRKWRVASRLVWTFPLGLKKLNIDICFVVVLLIGCATAISMVSAGSRALTLLASGAMCTLAGFAFVDDTPLLAVARRHRSVVCDLYRRRISLDALSPESLTHFADAISVRRSYWESARKSYRYDIAKKSFQQFDRRSRFYMYGGMSVYCAFSFVQSNMFAAAPGLKLPMTIIGFVAFIAAITASRRRLGRALRETTESLSQAQCPDCSYTLAAIPNAIDPALLNGISTGPARCPECGTHWPLVPPPVPSN